MPKLLPEVGVPEATWTECEKPALTGALILAGGFLVKGNAWCLYRAPDGKTLYRHHFRFDSGKIVDIQWEKLT